MKKKGDREEEVERRVGGGGGPERTYNLPELLDMMALALVVFFFIFSSSSLPKNKNKKFSSCSFLPFFSFFDFPSYSLLSSLLFISLPQSVSMNPSTFSNDRRKNLSDLES